MKSFISLAILLFASFAHAQTITPNESQIVLQSPKKIGINLNAPTYYQGGEIYKNLLWRNPGFEPDLYRDKFVAYKAGSTTTFPSPDFYDPVISNFWTGATFRLYRGSEPRTTVCSGTIAGNTTSSGSNGPVYKFATPCSSAVEAGDVIILRQAIPCTTEAVWEDAGAGWWGSVANGGKLLSECTAPYDGAQSLRMDASAAGSNAAMHGYVDTNPTDVGILMNGTYTISGVYKTVGNPTLSVNASRLTTSPTGNPFFCATQTFSAVSTWTPFTVTCTGSETRYVTTSNVQVSLIATGGVVLLDDVAFQKINTDPTNTTVFRDELVATLKAHCAGASLTGVPCELRDWAFQNADEIQNSVKPMFQRSPALPGTNYDYPPNGGTGALSVGLEEFLQLCQLIGAEPYYVLPETTGPEDAAAWIEYLNGSVNTTYGAIRASHGQSASWLSVFPTIHLPMGNENWNEGNTGQGLGYRPAAPDLYYDYSADAAGVWNQMRASASWPAGGAGIDLVLGFQDGNPNNGITEAWARAQPNSGELAPYTQAYIGDVAPLTSLWNPLFYEVGHNTTNPNLTFFQQGSAIKAHGKLNVYEYDNATSGGGAGLNQSVLDHFTDAAGYGTATALQSLQHLTFGIVDQNFFSLDQYAFYVPNIGFIHNWGAVIDMGGATNAVRPQELGMRMANAAIIGPMYSCPIANPSTYNLLANHNGSDSTGMPATNNVQLEYSYCFMSGNQRSMIVINTDVTNSHTVTFAGAQAPTGTVTLTRYDPSSISSTNEGTADGPTNLAAQNVAIDAPITKTALVNDVLPPYSITRYDWSTDGTVTTPPVTPPVTPPTTATATATALSSSATAVTVGTPVTFWAHVGPVAATGPLTFQQNGVSVAAPTLVNGWAHLVVSLPAGSHVFTATYAGTSTYAPSVSSSLTVDVAAAPITKAAATTTGLAVSSTTPVGGSAIQVAVTMNSASVTGTVTLMSGQNALASNSLTSGKAVFTVADITPGSHTYTAQFAGTNAFAASASNAATVVASAIPTQLAVIASNSAVVGSPLALTASITPSSATGSITFKDGSTVLGTASLTSGSAVYTISALAGISHSFSATYVGNATYASSTSGSVSLSTGGTLVPYIQTSFNEHAAGTPLNGSVPAVNAVGAKWSDANGDWTYLAGGGIKSDTPDLTNPVLLDVKNPNYTATITVPKSYGERLLFRYTDLNNMLFIVTFEHEVDLYSMVHGQSMTLATVYPSSTIGAVSLTLSGQSATLTCGGKTATGTVPTSIAPSTKLGFQPNSNKMIVSGFEVTP